MPYAMMIFIAITIGLRNISCVDHASITKEHYGSIH